MKNNQNALPLSKNLKRLCVIGQAADDLGMQCGGWTISWQGETGKVTTGTTILEAIWQTVSPSTVVSYSADGSQIGAADAILVVIGEKPYAEVKGYRSDLRLSEAENSLVKKAKQSGAPVITMLVSGRPFILGEASDASDAVIAAWLPGTEGQGVADVLFGDFRPTGKLPRAWLDASVPTTVKKGSESEFAFGYGLTYGVRGLEIPGGLKAASASK